MLAALLLAFWASPAVPSIVGERTTCFERFRYYVASAPRRLRPPLPG